MVEKYIEMGQFMKDFEMMDEEVALGCILVMS